MKFCVVGTGRCGTRLLRSMLNAHPDVFVFNETHWIANLHECFGTAEVPVDDLIDIVLRTRHVDGSPTTELDSDAFRAAMTLPYRMTPAGFANAVGLFFARQEGKTLWADKTPDYGYFAANLQLYWPDCRIIHLVRDGASVVRSMAGHPGYRALVALGRQHWLSLSLDYPGFSGEISQPRPEQYVELWYRRLMRIRNEYARLRPGSYIEIRHEDVLATPEAVLTRIAGFAGLRPDEAWLKGAGSLIDAQKATKSRPDAVLRHFGEKHLRLMHELGYPTEMPVEP